MQKCNFSSIRSVKNRLVIAAKLTFVVLNVVVLSLFIRRAASAIWRILLKW